MRFLRLLLLAVAALLPVLLPAAVLAQFASPTTVWTNRVQVYAAPAGSFVTGINSAGLMQTQALFGAQNVWTARQTFGGGAFTATANYSGGIGASAIVGLAGAGGSPNTSQDAVLVIQKKSASTATTGVNAAAYSSIHKWMTGANTRASAHFFECEDSAGGAGSWCEGVKAITSLTGGALGSAYGGVLSAGTAVGVSYTYLVAVEPAVENQSGVNAPQWSSLNINSFAAAVVATSGTNNPSANKVDVAFLTNPYSGAPFRTGFGCYGNDGAGHAGVDHTCFAAKGALTHGVDLLFGTYSGAAVRLPNMGVVRARDAANSADHNILYYDGSNQVVIGADATAIVYAKPVVSVSYQRSTAFVSAGSPPTITGSGACTISTQTGGQSAGMFKATAACAAAQTYTISGLPASVTGYACAANDQTTAGVVFQQTANTTTSATLTIRTTGVAANDFITFACIGA